MTKKAILQKQLDTLIADAEEQTQWYHKSQERLYRTLANVYLWWRESNKVEGFLDELYEERGLFHRKKEENFTRLVRLIWQADWSGDHPKLQNWARALRGLDHEFRTNRDAYQVEDPIKKICQFFRYKRGIGAVARTVDPIPDENDEIQTKRKKSASGKKSDIEILSVQKIHNKHVLLGELSYAEEPPYIKNIVSGSTKIDLTRKGYAVGLIRKNSTGRYDLLSVTNNEAIVHDTIVDTYKRNEDLLPPILRTITEAIATQTLPTHFEKFRQDLNDVTSVLASDGKTRLRTVKRLLLRPKTKDIILSECRTGCSVVTIVTPNQFPTNLSEDVFLRSVNHKYIEQNMLQTRDLCFYTTLTKKIEKVEDKEIKASHRLKIKNTVTDRIHNMYFYGLTSQSDGSKKQAAINYAELGNPTWIATVTKEWLEDLQISFISDWLSQYGHQWNRDRHKHLALELSKSFLIRHYGTRGEYTTPHSVALARLERFSKPITFHLRSKDFITVFHAIAKQNIAGEVKLAANEHVFTIYYKTEHATYLIAVPTCNEVGHLNSTAFTTYAD